MVTALCYPFYHRAAFRHAGRGGAGRNQYLRLTEASQASQAYRR